MLSRRLLRSVGGGESFADFAPTASGQLVTVGAAAAIDTGTGYKAFPGLCVTPGGNLLLVYRHGSEHISADGHIVARVSTDGGTTWGDAYTVYDPADDARDPSLSTLSDGRIALSTFRYDGTNAYQVEVLFSDDDGATFGTPVVIDTYYAGNGVTYAYAAVSAPVVELDGGDLLLPVYMRNSGGSTNWNAFVVFSTDGGTTFGDAVLIATGGGNSWTEPWVVRDPADGDLYCLIRVDNLNDTYTCTSDDDGATWGTPAFSWDGDARNATILTRSRALFTVGRSGTVQGQYGTSWNLGTSWTARTNLPSPSDNFQYAAVAQPSRRSIVVVWSQEVSSSDADLYAQAFDDTGTG